MHIEVGQQREFGGAGVQSRRVLRDDGDRVREVTDEEVALVGRQNGSGGGSLLRCDVLSDSYAMPSSFFLPCTIARHVALLNKAGRWWGVWGEVGWGGRAQDHAGPTHF